MSISSDYALQLSQKWNTEIEFNINFYGDFFVDARIKIYKI